MRIISEEPRMVGVPAHCEVVRGAVWTGGSIANVGFVSVASRSGTVCCAMCAVVGVGGWTLLGEVTSGQRLGDSAPSGNDNHVEDNRIILRVHEKISKRMRRGMQMQILTVKTVLQYSTLQID